MEAASFRGRNQTSPAVSFSFFLTFFRILLCFVQLQNRKKIIESDLEDDFIDDSGTFITIQSTKLLGCIYLYVLVFL